METNILSIFLLGLVGVVLVDTLGSIISKKYKIHYGWFFIGSVIVFCLVSINIAKISGDMIGIWASTGIGIFDATVGCLIAKKLDPYIGNIDFEWELSPSLVVYMGLVGAFFGWIGTLIF